MYIVTSNHVMMCVGDVKVGDVKVVAVRWETSRTIWMIVY